MRHEIEIEITPDGEITFKVKGAPGEQCLELTRELEEELGLVVSREKTSEFYQAEVNAEAEVKVGEE